MAVTLNFGKKNYGPADCSVFLVGREEHEPDRILRFEVYSQKLVDLQKVCQQHDLKEVVAMALAEWISFEEYGYACQTMNDSHPYVAEDEIEEFAEGGFTDPMEDGKVYDTRLFVNALGWFWFEVYYYKGQMETTETHISEVLDAVKALKG
jgi:hypothetical protein